MTDELTHSLSITPQTTVLAAGFADEALPRADQWAHARFGVRFEVRDENDHLGVSVSDAGVSWAEARSAVEAWVEWVQGKSFGIDVVEDSAYWEMRRRTDSDVIARGVYSATQPLGGGGYTVRSRGSYVIGSIQETAEGWIGRDAATRVDGSLVVTAAHSDPEAAMDALMKDGAWITPRD